MLQDTFILKAQLFGNLSLGKNIQCLILFSFDKLVQLSNKPMKWFNKRLSNLKK